MNRHINRPTHWLVRHLIRGVLDTTPSSESHAFQCEMAEIQTYNEPRQRFRSSVCMRMCIIVLVMLSEFAFANAQTTDQVALLQIECEEPSASLCSCTIAPFTASKQSILRSAVLQMPCGSHTMQWETVKMHGGTCIQCDSPCDPQPRCIAAPAPHSISHDTPIVHMGVVHLHRGKRRTLCFSYTHLVLLAMLFVLCKAAASLMLHKLMLPQEQNCCFEHVQADKVQFKDYDGSCSYISPSEQSGSAQSSVDNNTTPTSCKRTQ